MVKLIHILAVFAGFLVCVNIVLLIGVIKAARKKCVENKKIFHERSSASKPIKISRYPFITSLVQISDDQKPVPITYICSSYILSKFWTVSGELCVLYIEQNQLKEDSVGIVGNTNKWARGKLHRVDKWIRKRGRRDDGNIVLFRVTHPFTGKFERSVPVASNYKIRPQKIVTEVGWRNIRTVKSKKFSQIQVSYVKIYFGLDCQKLFHSLLRAAGPVFCGSYHKMANQMKSCDYYAGRALIDNKVLIGISYNSELILKSNSSCKDENSNTYIRVWLLESWLRAVQVLEGEDIVTFKKVGD